MSAEFVAVVYGLLVVLASLGGGWIPLQFRLSHTQMQVALSFVAGVMLGVGILHLIPHAYLELHDIDRTVRWALVGFLVVFFLERVFDFHHHDVAVDLKTNGGHDQAEGHGHHHGHHGHPHPPLENHSDRRSRPHRLSWGAAAIGLALHSLIDGAALAAGVIKDSQDGQGSMLPGLGIFLAIFLHKPFDSLTIGTLMSASSRPAAWRHAVNFLYALVAPVGMAIFFLGIEHGGGSQRGLLGGGLAFAAGAFLCIATSDLLPELQFHSHDRVKLSVSLLLGILLAWAIVLVETTGHEHF
jgi:zinc and cadmium transporter